jgi:ferredoxin
MPKVSLKIDQENQDFEIEENEILYHGIEKQGVELPHGCLAGSCGSCRILVLEGDENLGPPSYIEGDTISHLTKEYEKKFGTEFLKDKVIRLSCRAKIKKGSVKISPLK